MSSYSKPCIFYKQEIKMSNDSGNWLPYNLDNSPHECRESTKKDNKTTSITTEKNQSTLEDLDTRLQKVEKVLFGDN